MFSLSAYTASVSSFGSSKELPLDSFDGQSNLLNVIHAFIKSKMGGDMVFAHKKRIMRFVDVDPINNNEFVARIQTGEYGFTSDIYDTHAKKSAHIRKKTEAEMLPFFLYVYVPKGKQTAILIFQRFKNFGARSYFTSELYPYFTAQFPKYTLKLSKAVPSAVLNEILNKGQVKVFRFVKYQATSDICDAMMTLDKDATTAEVEYVIKAKRNSFFGALDPLKKEFSKAKPNFKSIVEIPNFDYDTIKVDIDVAGKRRSVDLGKIFKISANVDITNDVILDVTGHPTKESFKAQAADIAKNISL